MGNRFESYFQYPSKLQTQGIESTTVESRTIELYLSFGDRQIDKQIHR